MARYAHQLMIAVRRSVPAEYAGKEPGEAEILPGSKWQN
jgi:hypothetical protein